MMISYIENIDGVRFYVAELSGKKCSTYNGFMKELIGSFNLPSDTPMNINAIMGYVLSSWLGYSKIKIVIVESNVLKKKMSRYDEILELLNNYKVFWENEDVGNKLVIVD